MKGGLAAPQTGCRDTCEKRLLYVASFPGLPLANVLRMTFDPTEKRRGSLVYTYWHVSNVLGRHRTTQELQVDTERRNVIVSETWSWRGDGVFARERDREQGPRQEEDVADQAQPGRPPAVSLLAKIPAA